ncbi:ribonucleotide-diphosphate reductase subunit beta [Persicobacter psychrovividus]|uniref:ribonucleoside-diphosphate reductase n=1 Tax=Persicobacter psychrovividus TaxID=387638 RepID=A0ABN6LBC4_9BACT|nr:ribonucleoside-diphosphate reductase subunit beta [Persicobacter psychrovividus]
MGIFDRRIAYKPLEYPEVLPFIDAINQTFWVHSEVDFSADIQDFKVNFSEKEQFAVKNALKSIAQVEVSVKQYWGNLFRHLPKPEFNGLGATFAECEWRHSEAYSRLLEVLGIADDEFEAFVARKEIQGRLEVLTQNIQLKSDHSRKDFLKSLAVFALLVENVSLFSQFAIILSFTKFKGQLKNTSNIIAWTSKDEQIHANAGIWLFNQVAKEYPELIDEEFLSDLKQIAADSLKVEDQILDMIFEHGELEHISKYDLKQFMIARTAKSLEDIGIHDFSKPDPEAVKRMLWFEEEVFANTQDDFFAKRPVDYSKHNQSITADDLF